MYILVFALLLVFSIHNFDSIGQDIGRHLKVGEIIWQTKEVPKTNLFSFTEPDFPFINHHWLSEVIFFKIFGLAGFTGLILVKTLFIFIAFLLLFFVAKSYAKFWSILISFLFSIFIFIQRTEVRPEIFSFVILAFFLFALFKAKYPVKSQDDHGTSEYDYKYLWFLPILELLWVNLHIYFFIGPILIFFFLIDRFFEKKKINPKSKILNSKQYPNYKFQFSKLLTIFILIVLATLINPAGIKGALLPFNVLKEYGYSIVENQTLSFLAAFFGFNLSIFVFKLSAAILAVSFALTIKKVRQRIFEMLISVFFIYAGFKMLRNLPLYALVSFPVMAIVLTDIEKVSGTFLLYLKRFLTPLKLSVSALLVLLIFWVINNSFYGYVKSSRVFGFSVPNGLERAVDFVKENKIEGPMFNNFDVGGYLIWRLSPEEKVFVDNRPEAYSVDFFNKIYKPMQESKEKWLEFYEKYGINFVFFGHTDATPWGQSFLNNIVKNPDWQVVYINESAIILVKDNKKNSEIISKFSITEKNAIDSVTGYIKDSKEDSIDLNLILARVFYNIDWRETSVYFSEEVIKLDPKNPRAYLYKGLSHAYWTDRQNQELAAENIKKVIDLGLKDSQYYTILGIVYMNLGRFDEAKVLFIKALELDENNAQAKKFLDAYFKNSKSQF